MKPLNFSNIKTHIYNKYSSDPSKILIHTSVLGWILSSLAQIGAIFVNDKIDSKDKAFLIPQEFADACVNIGAYLLITTMFTRVSKKLVKTGRFRTSSIDEFCRKNKFFERIASNNQPTLGEFKFNMENRIKSLISSCKKRLSKPNLNSKEINNIETKIAELENFKKDYKRFENGIGIIGTTIGTILSCNILTPIIRNEIAVHQQKKLLAAKDKIYNRYYQKNKDSLQAPRGITIDQYQQMVNRHSSGTIKI